MSRGEVLAGDGEGTPQSCLRGGEADERQGTIAMLKIFGGLETKEMAEYLGVSERTVRGDWHEAKVWLRRRLAESRT